ncbi:hypothetical protein SAMN05421853_102211 [Roseivivax halotolerans]|uniref:Uncharacterized protein n=1 Tax=Roseivivax halotolerans TaxID=93684 RepID=A0A1I5W9L4_9RHOB|nr:hypothetical protein [Roseivivax halotolerans]SFQ16452.1 hypothetical protein SAMN05421853_102211 [Roseivivax halotolerans]
MRRIFVSLLGLGLVAGCAMPPEGTDEADVASFDRAVASIGCDLVDEGDYQAVEIQTGLSRPQTQEMASFRVETDAAVRLSNGGMRLVTGSCAPAEPAAEPADEETA